MASSRRNPFIWLSGGDPEVLDAGMISERRKFIKLGLTILVPAVSAWGAMWFAAPYIGIEVGKRILLSTIWSLIVLVIDSYLVSTLDKRYFVGKRWRYYTIAGFRLLVSVFIGIVISHPLVLKILEQNITEEMRDMKRERGLNLREAYADTARKWTVALTYKIDSIEKEIKKYEILKTAEINGDQIRLERLTTSGQRGLGISYRMLSAKLVGLQNERKHLIDSVASKTVNLLAEADTRVRELDTTWSSDYLKRSLALSRLKRFNTTNYLVWLLMIFLVLLDSIAVIAKMLTPVGVYEIMLSSREELKEKQFRELESLFFEEKMKMTRAVYARSEFHPPDVIQRSVETIWQGTPGIKQSGPPSAQEVIQRSFNQLFFLVFTTLIGLLSWYFLDRYLPKEANGNISILLSFYMSVCAGYAGLKK